MIGSIRIRRKQKFQLWWNPLERTSTNLSVSICSIFSVATFADLTCACVSLYIEICCWPGPLELFNFNIFWKLIINDIVKIKFSWRINWDLWIPKRSTDFRMTCWLGFFLYAYLLHQLTLDFSIINSFIF